MRWLFLPILALGIACSEPAPAPQPAAPVAPAFQLATPNVTMDADPPPPFTYWAPEGSTISNHPNVPGVWNADLNGESVSTYFGDQCRASAFQQYVGQPLETFPQSIPGVEIRQSCTTCGVNQDLRPNRINVVFNEATQFIERIACY